MEFELTPIRQYKISKQGTKKMAKNNQEVPTAKTRKVYQKTRTEHYKDIVIAILITGIIAFCAGMYFANNHNEQLKAAANKIVPTASAEVKK